MEYSRPPEGFRFNWGGMKLNSVPDAIPPEKYAVAINVRSTSKNSIKTRPGYASKFVTGGHTVSDIRAYATLQTDDLPRFLARDVQNGIYLDTGTLLTTLGGSVGYGVSMIPFRPSTSPQSWMYIAGLGAYQKLSAPSATNAVTIQKVGIAEPQSQLEAATNAPEFTYFNGVASGWTAGGTAGAPSNGSVIVDTAGVVLPDPVVATRLSIQVTNPYYIAGQVATIASSTNYPIEEVWQPCPTCTITAIQYDAGTSGMCSVVPSLDISSTLGRGSLVELNSEIVLVLSVTAGTNGTCVFRCSTSGTHAASETITGILAIVLHGSVTASQAINVNSVSSIISTGTGTLSQTLTAGLFAPYGPDDYIHIPMSVNDAAATTSITFIFNLGTSAPDYVTKVATYTLDQATLLAQLVGGVITEIHFPISALGTDPGLLNSCNGIQVQVVCTANEGVSVDGLWVGGGSLPDVGDSGAPYMFRAVPRSSLTGAQGNSTPPMRYGVIPRRQSVTLTVPSAAYDSQIDTWDYYAIGGTITQYGYVGSVAAGASTFTFNYFDDTIAAAIANGNTLPVQNFEPWPSVDIPWSAATAGGGTTITIVGSELTVSGPATWPSTIANWLPGTLITVSGFQTYTLRARPVQLSSTSYLFHLQESAGSQSPSSVAVSEPNIANQILPYVWGPDAYGTIFAAGDPLRPGTQYFAQAYAPDEAPQTNTIEVSTPDKPLVGGVVKSGVSIAASTNRWWAYYPNLGGSGYYQVEMSVGASPVSPYGIVTDGNWIYFWSKDGICRTSGSGFESLTDDDLYNLFPHEGVQGANVTRFGAITIFAPDYSRAAMFRLCLCNNFLYADYRDAAGSERTLVYDLRNKAWCYDQYADPIAVHYGVEQQQSSLTASSTLYSTLLMGSAAGHVYVETDLHNDNTTGITASIQTFEFDGQDVRAFEQWGDLYLDSIPVAGISVTPLFNQSSIATLVAIPASPNRTFSPISVGGEVQVDFLGMALRWTDNFSTQSVSTVVHAWQPSWVQKPEFIIDRASDWMGSLSG
jgi:hypothetical protein